MFDSAQARMEMAEYQREQQEVRESIKEVCYACVAGGDETRKIPEDAEHHASGEHSCEYHFPEEHE